MFDFAKMLIKKIREGQPPSDHDALKILAAKGARLTALMAGAQSLKEEYFEDQVGLCSIINAKSGQCAENCSFCAQSVHHQARVESYPLKTAAQMLEGAKAAEAQGNGCYGIVTSGTRVDAGEEFEELLKAFRAIRSQTGINPSASIGLLDEKRAHALAEAGCGTYHHNLETARSFFPSICTTHDYEEDVATIRLAKEAGMKVCCGGIFGLGESLEQRVELGMTLRELDVDSVPLNFLNPIDGTPLEGQHLLTPMDCLRIICLFRYLLPTKKITVCGGRDVNLREFQSSIFMAGASGMMIGNYLTSTGRNLDVDRQLLADAEVKVCPLS